MKTEELNCNISQNTSPAVILPYDMDKEYNVEDLGEIEKKPFYCFWKRFFDIIISALALIVTALPMLIIAIVVRCTSKGPAIFKQKRLGYGGKEFVIYKFRTMRVDAPDDVASREFENADQYITKVGKFLRKSSLDEIPQFVNVICGEMSIVGFRPVCLTETGLNELRAAYGVFLTKPGITGYAQVLGRDNLTMEKKALLDAEYARKRCCKLDLWCIMKTVSAVFTGEGAL